MDGVIVIGETHGEGVRNAARDGDFLTVEIDRDLRKLDLLALKARRFGAEGDREFRLAGNGLHCQGEDITEFACRSFAVLSHQRAS